MYARVSIWKVQAGTIDEATDIIRDVMLPSASKLQGFKGAFMLRHDTDPDKHIVISLWESKDDLLASRPPDEIIPLLEPLDDYIIESEQGTYNVILALYNQ